MSAQPQDSPPVGSLALYLTAEELGQILRVSAKTVYRMAKTDPSMPMLQLGRLGTVRFPRERLLEWLRDQEQGRPRIRRPVLSLGKPASTQEAAGAAIIATQPAGIQGHHARTGRLHGDDAA